MLVIVYSAENRWPLAALSIQLHSSFLYRFGLTTCNRSERPTSEPLAEHGIPSVAEVVAPGNASESRIDAPLCASGTILDVNSVSVDDTYRAVISTPPHPHPLPPPTIPVPNA